MSNVVDIRMSKMSVTPTFNTGAISLPAIGLETNQTMLSGKIRSNTTEFVRETSDFRYDDSFAAFSRYHVLLWTVSLHDSTRPGGRKKNLGLSAKEYSKITGTIASVRRNRQLSDDIYEDADVRLRSSRQKLRSFVRAPLNSRVGASTSIPKTKGKAKKMLLVDIQEALIVEDLLYVLMDIEEHIFPIILNTRQKMTTH
ncbi:hypothetical protein F4604DRAFT_1901596 [Suillus subluteus]|nr:hypothetical protein F4604DRAFT_1901596 [Suillus subluteus]